MDVCYALMFLRTEVVGYSLNEIRFKKKSGDCLRTKGSAERQESWKFLGAEDLKFSFPYSSSSVSQ